MEDQLGALGLVFNAVVLWTTWYIDAAAVDRLRAEGHEILGEDVAWLSPLEHRNLNVLGRCSFTASPRELLSCRSCAEPDDECCCGDGARDDGGALAATGGGSPGVLSASQGLSATPAPARP